LEFLQSRWEWSGVVIGAALDTTGRGLECLFAVIERTTALVSAC